MKKSSKVVNKGEQNGFTLVELLIVVIILAILAAIVVPQFASSTEDANASTLKSDLTALRNAVETYYQQHDTRYPGKYLESDGTTAAAAGTCPAAFVAQLTLYSDKYGKTNGSKTTVFKYGPYIKGASLPANPFSDANANAVTCDVTVVDLSTAVAVTAPATGWKIYTGTGRLVANDGKTLNDGVTKTIDF